MPELPEVETVCRGLSAVLPGHSFTHIELRRKDLRLPFPANLSHAIENNRVIRISRRAKYILIFFADAKVLIIHLGMSGRILVFPHKRNAAEKHDHVIMDLDDGKEVAFNDPRRFGLMDITTEALLAKHPLLASLGVEPLEDGFTADYMRHALAGKKIPIKVALMDHHIVVGIGNIYACESLFKARINPQRPAKEIPPDALERLVPAAQEILRAAITAGGSTLKDYVQASGERGYFQHRFSVYGRDGKPCFDCGTAITRIVQSGRSTFFCPACQAD